MSGEPERVELRVAHLDCETEAAQLRRGLAGVPGVSQLEVLPRAGRVRLTLDPAATSREAVQRRLAELGFPVLDRPDAPQPPPPWRNPKVVTSAASGALLLLGYATARLGAPDLAVQGVYLSSVVIGGWYFAREATVDLLWERRVGIELLMSVAAVVAFALGHAGEAAMLAFLYSISEAAEGYTEERTRASIRALMKLAPKVATLRRDGVDVEVPVDEVSPGDVFRVRPGEAVATDGVVVAGSSTLDEAPITGESTPVEKRAGDQVFAASINGQGALEVRATRPFAENTLNRIIHLVEEAQEQRGHSQRFIERFGAVYSPLVLVSGVLVGVAGAWLFGLDPREAAIRATVLVVAAAPCALAISVPITFVAALGRAARDGVLVKGGVHLEDLATVRVIALDKTGTLTSGRPEVTDVVAVRADVERGRVLALAAAVEAHSEHPLARAIVRAAEREGVRAPAASDFQSRTGVGATARVDDALVSIGSLRALEESPDAEEAQRLTASLTPQGKSIVVVSVDGRLTGVIGLRDDLRPEARAAIAELRAAGTCRIVMLSGDHALTAQAIGAEAGVDEVQADLRPEAKVEAVRALAREHGAVLMVGDGMNDAPALAAATVGVAMGVAGTDVALETADVALMGDDLRKLAYALRIARRTRRVVRQNLALSTAVIAVLVVGAVTGSFGLPSAVLAHEVSELMVIASGLRLVRGPGRSTGAGA